MKFETQGSAAPECRRLLPMRLVLGAALAALLFSGTAAASHAADSAALDVPEGTASAWVDVEGSGLKAHELSGTISGSNGPSDLTFLPSPTGLTAVINDVPSSVSVELEAATESDALVAVTFATAEGDIVSGTSSRVTIPVGETVIVTTPPKGNGGSPPSQTDGVLRDVAATGGDSGWMVALGAVLALLGTAAIVLRKKGARTHA